MGRTLRCLALLAFIGCGNNPSHNLARDQKLGPRQVAEAPVDAAPPDAAPAAPSGGEPQARIVADVAALVDRLCACADAECLLEVSGPKLLETLGARDDDDPVPGVKELLERGEACVDRFPEVKRAPKDKDPFEAFVEHVCSCMDMECLQKVTIEMATSDKYRPDPKQVGSVEMRRQSEQMTDCVTKLVHRTSRANESR